MLGLSQLRRGAEGFHCSGAAPLVGAGPTCQRPAGRPPPDLHQCFEREVDLRLSAGLVLRMVDLRLFVCAWLRLPWILPLHVCTNAPCAPHDIVSPMLSHAGAAENEYFPLGVSFDALVPAASTAESNVCSGWEATTKEPKCELIQPLLSEHRRYDASMSELPSSDACFSQNADGSNVAMTDIEESVLSAGQGVTGSVSSELLPVFQLLMFPVLGSTMTRPACRFPSSSDAPDCASLARAASAKSSLPTHARTNDRATVTFIDKRVKDDHPRTRLWTSARCPRTQKPYRWPPHPRGLRPHRRLSSMSPARASFGQLRVSQGRYHRVRTKCLACEARVDSCPSHFWERLPESVRRQRLWTASLQKTKGGLFDLSRPDSCTLHRPNSLASRVSRCDRLVLFFLFSFS